jgi:hypothetical protein
MCPFYSRFYRRREGVDYERIRRRGDGKRRNLECSQYMVFFFFSLLNHYILRERRSSFNESLILIKFLKVHMTTGHFIWIPYNMRK